MALKLKPGTKKPLPGNADGYVNSMAQAMEQAFMEEWPYVMHRDAPAPNDQMRLMFIAVARGVVKHLHDNPGSFLTTNPGGAGHVTSIEVE